MIAGAGSVFVSTINFGPTGLVGTIGVQIRNTDGTVQTARTTAGIVETVPGSGIYTKDDIVAPSTTGDYVLVWDDTDEFISTELEVVPAGATGQDYCTLGEVKNALSIPDSQNNVDYDIQRAITAASREIDHLTGCQFYPDSVATARKFTPDSAGTCFVGMFQETASLVVNWSGSNKTLNTEYYLQPQTGPPYHTIRTGWGFWMPTYVNALTVTAKWGVSDAQRGFDINEAAVILATRLFRRSREASLGVIGFGMDGSPVRITWDDPDIQRLLGHYKRVLVG